MLIDRRRLLLAGAGAGALVATRVSAQPAPDFSALYQAARKEGEITWYIAQIDSDAAERVGQLFEKTYTGIKINVVRATGQVIYQRLSQDMKAQVKNCDVFGTTDLGQLVTLKQSKSLLAYEAKNLAFCDPVFATYDPQHYISITGANCTSLVYNTSLVKPEEAPKKWTDLLDPKWSGQVSLGHPGFSGAMGAWVVEMNKMYGWEFFDKLAKNKPLVGRSLVEPPTAIAAGERKLGIGPSNLILQLKSRGNPLEISYAQDGVMLQIGPTCILTDAPHPNAAKLFMEFLLSREVGELLAEDRGIPYRTDVHAAPGVVPVSTLKIIKADPEELAKQVPVVTEKWRDTFGV